MKKDKRLDILLVGRPDHSMFIYDSLQKQKNLQYHFITFKVLPLYLKRFFRKFNAQFVGDNVSISITTTFINICRYPLKLKFARKWSERGRLAPLFIKIVKKREPKIIHYWSTYANDAIESYAKTHPEVICIKDIHMPSFATVYEAMKTIANKYNMPELAESYYKRIKSQIDELKDARTLLVPSEYVLNSYKNLLPEKEYIIVPYGVTKSKEYKKKKKVSDGHKFSFVYIGRISLEKGCDVLMDYFIKHPEYELHLYGSIPIEQESLFRKDIASNIHFHGSIPKIDVQKEISGYDIGIHLSRFDAYSLGVGEMIGCGLPVIVSISTGNECDVRNYNFGKVADLSSESIDQCVKSLITPRIYNDTVDSIDRYLTSDMPNYGEKMVSVYNTLIKDNLP